MLLLYGGIRDFFYFSIFLKELTIDEIKRKIKFLFNFRFFYNAYLKQHRIVYKQCNF